MNDGAVRLPLNVSPDLFAAPPTSDTVTFVTSTISRISFKTAAEDKTIFELVHVKSSDLLWHIFCLFRL